jgi:predicted DNA-binding transcriptional regulator AlpA
VGVTKVLAPTRDDLREQGGVSPWYIAKKAGISDRSDGWILNTIRNWIAQENFPKPLPHYDLQNRRRAEVNLHSRWIRAAVDAWFDGQLPPHVLEGLADRTAANDAGLLDQRADELAATGRL